MADRSRGLKLLATGESVNVHVTLNRAGRQRPARVDAVPVKLSLSGDLAVTRTVVFTSPRLTATTPTDRWFDVDTPCSGCCATAENAPIAALSRSAHVVVSRRGTGRPFSRHSLAPHDRRINLAAALGSSHLEPGAVVEVAITTGGKIGVVVRYAIRRRAGPVRTILCQTPGASGPRRFA